MNDYAKNNNPTYFRFIDLAIKQSRAGVFKVKKEAAVAYVQTVLRMVRDEYQIGGEEQIRKLLNIDGNRLGVCERERQMRRRKDDL